MISIVLYEQKDSPDSASVYSHRLLQLVAIISELTNFTGGCSRVFVHPSLRFVLCHRAENQCSQRASPSVLRWDEDGRLLALPSRAPAKMPDDSEWRTSGPTVPRRPQWNMFHVPINLVSNLAPVRDCLSHLIFPWANTELPIGPHRCLHWLDITGSWHWSPVVFHRLGLCPTVLYSPVVSCRHR